MTLTSTLSETTTKELKRALNSPKAYLYFDISVFNVGAAISIKCTDNFKQPRYRTWNGYDFIIENDETTKFYLTEELKNR
jgi:hypothetical protein